MPPAPSGAPTSVNVSLVTSSSVIVRWGAVDCIHRNGNITGYLVQYQVQEDINSSLTVNTTERKLVITGLHLSTTYTVQVAAITRAGNGGYSKAAVITTIGIIIP